MKLSHFNFELPDELLAEYPAENRDESRLMVLNRKEQTIEHKMFKDLINYFDEEPFIFLIHPACIIYSRILYSEPTMTMQHAHERWT